MVLAFAGRRAQSLGGDLETVTRRIRVLLTALAPSAVVGALADGGDLLVAEVALSLGEATAVHVVLPTPEEVFRVRSVRTDWRDRFDRALEQVRQRGSVQSLGLEDGSDAYRRVNAAFLDRAMDLADDGKRVVTLVIAGEGEGEIVQDLVARAQLRNVPSLRIDPHVVLAQRPRVFVAMPYGNKKLDPQRKIEVDCDQVYKRILLPALENAQLDYHRGDEEIDSGLVLVPMIESLAEADLVIADLQTANFNVGWELGLRHLLRSRQTLLVAPQGVLSPFDVHLVRHIAYCQDEHGVSDDAAVAAWSELAPYLCAVSKGDSRSDSPVDAVMEVTQWGVVRRRSAGDERWQSLREQLALARDVADGDLMLEVLDRAQGLESEALALLRAEAGVGLVRLGRYTEARALLRAVVEEDREVLRPDAHVYYAGALYRPPDADVEAYDTAERVLNRLRVKRPGHPEVWAMLGAIAKRRMQLRTTGVEREPDLRLAMDSYLHEYERNLSAYYQGINVVAVAVVLDRVYGDEAAGRHARELLAPVRVAAGIGLRADARDYWAAATLAECALHESLLGLDGPGVADAYRAAGALRPRRGDLDSTLFQLDFLGRAGLPEQPLAAARAGLLSGAGIKP